MEAGLPTSTAAKRPEESPATIGPLRIAARQESQESPVDIPSTISTSDRMCRFVYELRRRRRRGRRVPAANVIRAELTMT